MEIAGCYNLCVNPYPILPQHITLPLKSHRPQEFHESFIRDLNKLLLQLPADYTVFYNGAACGASAPDHFHFQGAPKKYVPLVRQYHSLKSSARLLDSEHSFYYIDSYVCPIFAIETDCSMPEIDINQLLRHFPITEGENNPRFNIFAWREEERLFIVFIPRSKHRPDCFFAEGNDRCLVSPGALDMAGILVTARPEDFERMDAEKVASIIREVGLPFELAETIAQKYKQ
jgi:ATP adenylyltransferase/5',5'''-P-1,P-4-tetraphosphate phosphorylase II